MLRLVVTASPTGPMAARTATLVHGEIGERHHGRARTVSPGRTSASRQACRTRAPPCHASSMTTPLASLNTSGKFGPQENLQFGDREGGGLGVMVHRGSGVLWRRGWNSKIRNAARACAAGANVETARLPHAQTLHISSGRRRETRRALSAVDHDAAGTETTLERAFYPAGRGSFCPAGRGPSRPSCCARTWTASPCSRSTGRRSVDSLPGDAGDRWRRRLPPSPKMPPSAPWSSPPTDRRSAPATISRNSPHAAPTPMAAAPASSRCGTAAMP